MYVQLRNWWIRFLAIAIVACGQSPVADTFLAGYPEGDGNDGPVIELCDDGTMSCYYTPPEQEADVPPATYDETFDECMYACLESTGCAYPDDYFQAESKCSDFTACENSCYWSSETSPDAGYPPSDPIAIPANSYAFLVEITGCFDVDNRTNQIIFQGPTISFARPVEGDEYNQSTSAFERNYYELGNNIGRNGICSNPNLKNRVQIKFTPWTEESITIGDGELSKDFTVLSADYVSTIEDTFASPHSIPFGIPPEILANADASQIAWVQGNGFEYGKYVTSSGSYSETEVDGEYDFLHYNNDIPYGASIFQLRYPNASCYIELNNYECYDLTGAYVVEQTIPMILFVKSLDSVE